MILPVMRRCRGDVAAMVFLRDHWAERPAVRLARGNVSEAALRSRNFLQASALLLSLLSLLRRGVNGDGNANRDGSLR